jgi:hypothetical protein
MLDIVDISNGARNPQDWLVGLVGPQRKIQVQYPGYNQQPPRPPSLQLRLQGQLGRTSRDLSNRRERRSSGKRQNKGSSDLHGAKVDGKYGQRTM